MCKGVEGVWSERQHPGEILLGTGRVAYRVCCRGLQRFITTAAVRTMPAGERSVRWNNLNFGL